MSGPQPSPSTSPPKDDTRRGFLVTFLGGALGLLGVTIALPAWKYIFPPKVEEAMADQVEAASISELPLSSGKIFRFQGKPAILIHTADDRWKAFDAVCTHLNCTVQYSDEKKAIWCACHGGTYDLSGHVIAGPPPRGLAAYTVALRGDKIIVSKG